MFRIPWIFLVNYVLLISEDALDMGADGVTGMIDPAILCRVVDHRLIAGAPFGRCLRAEQRRRQMNADQRVVFIKEDDAVDLGRSGGAAQPELETLEVIGLEKQKP